MSSVPLLQVQCRIKVNRCLQQRNCISQLPLALSLLRYLDMKWIVDFKQRYEYDTENFNMNRFIMHGMDSRDYVSYLEYGEKIPRIYMHTYMNIDRFGLTFLRVPLHVMMYYFEINEFHCKKQYYCRNC